MTDEQIIKAYERCFTLGFDESTCYECPFYTATAKCTEDLRDSTLDLINRQKAEIEELRERISYLEKSIDCSRKEYNRLLQKLQQAKYEAIKEFAERLKSISTGLEIGDDKKVKMMAVSTTAIDKIAKEMTEVKENEKQ